MHKLLILFLFLFTISCKKDTKTQKTHDITMKCWGTHDYTVVFNFGEGEQTYKGAFPISWTIIRDVPVGVKVTLSQTANPPGPKAASAAIYDGTSLVAIGENDTAATLFYIVR